MFGYMEKKCEEKEAEKHDRDMGMLEVGPAVCHNLSLFRTQSNKTIRLSSALIQRKKQQRILHRVFNQLTPLRKLPGITLRHFLVYLLG